MKKLLVFLSVFVLVFSVSTSVYAYSYQDEGRVSEPAIYDLCVSSDYYYLSRVNQNYNYSWLTLSENDFYNDVLFPCLYKNTDSNYWAMVLINRDNSIVSYPDYSLIWHYAGRYYNSGWLYSGLTDLSYYDKDEEWHCLGICNLISTNIPLFENYEDIVTFVNSNYSESSLVLNSDVANIPDIQYPETWAAPEPNTESIITGSDEGSYSSYVQVFKGDSPMRFVTKFFFKIPNNRDIVGGLGFDGVVTIKGQTGAGEKFSYSYNISSELAADYPIVSYDSLLSVSQSSVHLPGVDGEVTDYKGSGTHYPGSNELDINLHYLQAREEALRYQDIIINSVDITGLHYCYNNVIYAGAYSGDVFETSDYHFNLNTNSYTDSSGSTVGSANNGNFDNSYSNYYPKIDNLDDGGLYDFVSNGFGLFGKNGFFDMLQVSFYFLPSPLLAVIASGVGIVFVVICYKIIRG